MHVTIVAIKVIFITVIEFCIFILGAFFDKGNVRYFKSYFKILMSIYVMRELASFNL